MPHTATILSAITAAATLLASNTASASATHRVEQGDTLWSISKRYGCDVAKLSRKNGIRKNLIHAGNDLVLPNSCKKLPAAPKAPALSSSKGGVVGFARDKSGSPSQTIAAATEPKKKRRVRKNAALVAYKVRKGDTLMRIAQRYDTSIDDIRRRNRLRGDRIVAGATLEVQSHIDHAGLSQLRRMVVRTKSGQSVGRHSNGRLMAAVKLPATAGYHIRRPNLAWGAQHTVDYIQKVVGEVRRIHPGIHSLAIGDISARTGGKIRRHVSHQTGLDVDLGFYFKRKPKGYPYTFIRANEKTLNVEATFELLRALASTADEKGGVRMMFLDHGLQKLFYDYALSQGVSKNELSWLFQYPRPRGTRTGLIRHEPGHADHLHVRFKPI